MTEDELVQSLSAIAADRRAFAEVFDLLSRTAPTAESRANFNSRAAEERCQAEQFDNYAERVRKRAAHMQSAQR